MCREERVKKQRSDDAILELVRPLDLVSGIIFMLSRSRFTAVLVRSRAPLHTAYWLLAASRGPVRGSRYRQGGGGHGVGWAGAGCVYPYGAIISTT